MLTFLSPANARKGLQTNLNYETSDQQCPPASASITARSLLCKQRRRLEFTLTFCFVANKTSSKKMTETQVI